MFLYSRYNDEEIINFVENILRREEELLSKINNQFDSNIISFGYKNKGAKQ